MKRTKPIRLRSNYRYWLPVAFLLLLSSTHLFQSAFAQANGAEVWRTFISNGSVDEAIDAFKRAVEANSNDDMALAGLGYLSAHRMHEEPAPYFWEALHQGRTRPEATLYLLEAMRHVDDKIDALAALDQIDALLAEEDELADHLVSRIHYARGHLLRKAGRWDDSDEAFAHLNFITSFWYIGPFDNTEKRGHNSVFGPEENLDPTSTHPGRRREVAWRPMTIQPYDGYIDLHALISPSRDSTAYLATVIESPREQRVRFGFGHAGALKTWLNGELIADMNRYHSPLPDQVMADALLREGANTLLIKVSGGARGRFGLFARLALVGDFSLAEVDANDPFDISAHVPEAGQEILEDSLLFEPVAARQLKALGEAANRDAHRHFFYSRILQLLDIADENDQSVNNMLSQMNSFYPDNPLILTYLGDSERQSNRQRSAYARALEIDPANEAAFVRLLQHYENAPYATHGFNLIEAWQSQREVPARARLIEANLLRRKGLNDAALHRLATKEEPSIDTRFFTLETLGERLTDEEKARRYQAILDDDPIAMGAVHALRRLALRRGDSQAFDEWLGYERRLQPFSIVGLMDLANYLQAGDEYEASLETLREIQRVSPDDPEASRLEAVAWNALGNTQEALAALDRSLAVMPSDPWRLEYRELLQPEEENYATPFLVDWRDITIPEDFDLSKANYVNLLSQEIVKVFPNGNSRRTVREAALVLTEAGVRRQQAHVVPFETGREDVIVKRARVWKPDGTYVDAPPVEKRSAASAADAAARLYMDMHLAIVHFPALEKDAIIELEYEKISKVDNIYADYFGDQFFIGDTSLEPTARAEYILVTPSSRDFYWSYTPPNYPESIHRNNQTPDLHPEPEMIERDDERVYRWSFEHLPALPREPLMPFPSEILPYLIVSTFESWDEMSDWYWNLIKDHLIPGTPVRERTDWVVEEYKRRNNLPIEYEMTDWDKVRAVNAYVNTGIRYLGLEFGIQGYRPRRVDDVCNAQYGDCKDKAALAVVMLEELGVEAHIVIVRTTDRGEINYDLPSLGLFNHAIYYLPDVDGKEYWIDGTATFFDATELPPGDAGANGLVIYPGGGHEFKRIDITTAANNGAIYTTVLELDRDGGASGYRTAAFRGLFNPIIRSTYENPSKAKEIIDRSLTSQYPGAQSSNIELSDLSDYSTAESVSYELSIPRFGAQLSDAISYPSNLFKDEMSPRYAQLSTREYDVVLNYPWTRTYITRLKLPTSDATVDLPPDRELKTDIGEYIRTAVVEDNQVILREELVFYPIRVPIEMYDEFREFCRLVDLYQEDRILVRERG